MAKKRNSVHRESKEKFLKRKAKHGLRKFLHEDPLLAADRDESVGKTILFLKIHHY